MLEHNYTEANLRFDHLKGHDRVRAHCLQEVCRKQGFSLFLANLERMISGSCEESYGDHRYGLFDDEEGHHNIEDEVERALQLKTIALPNGMVFARDIEFEEEKYPTRRAFQ